MTLKVSIIGVIKTRAKHSTWKKPVPNLKSVRPRNSTSQMTGYRKADGRRVLGMASGHWQPPWWRKSNVEYE
jgi:hypothetical protein